MKQLLMLVRRELWEFQSTFIKLPFLIGALLVLVGFCSTLYFVENGGYPHLLNITMNSDTSYRNVVQLFTYFVSTPFVIILWLMVANYCLACLFDDRKNQSILFWQSMPVSQFKVILSKCITAFVVAPLLTIVMVIITEFILLVFLSFFVAEFSLGHPLMLWDMTTLLVTWLRLSVAFFIHALWLFPIYAWFMFCSAYARKTPFKMAVTIPIVVMVIEKFLDMNHLSLFDFIFGRLRTIVFEYFLLPSFNFPEGYLLSLGLGLLVGIFFLSVAGWMRSRCYHFDGV